MYNKKMYLSQGDHLLMKGEGHGMLLYRVFRKNVPYFCIIYNNILRLSPYTKEG